MTRRKPTTPQILNAAQADETLAEIARLSREIDVIQGAMNEDIDRAKAFARKSAEPLQARIKTLGESLGAYATYHKSELFKNTRTVHANHGSYGFRKASSLKPAVRLKWADVLQKVIDSGREGLLRIKREVNKEALRELPESQMEELGVRLVSKDEFWFEVEQDEVENVA